MYNPLHHFFTLIGDHIPPKHVLLFLFIIVGLWIIHAGYVAVRLWYHHGKLGPESQRYVIRPSYLKNRMTVMSEASVLPGRGEQSTETVIDLESDEEDGEEGEGSDQTGTNTDVVSAIHAPGSSTGTDRHSTWFGSIASHQTVRNRRAIHLAPSIREGIAEQRRISRLPHFEQDDCGDGSNFPDVPEADIPAGSSRLPAPPLSPRFKEKPGKYMTMGLRKSDKDEWLFIDDTYQLFWKARDELLRTKKEKVLAVLPEAEEACVELMREVVDFLTTKYPKYFSIVERRPGFKVVRNKIVHEEFTLTEPWDVHPLEMCARLAMEDFNVLVKSDLTGQHYLIASATLFPAGWVLPQRIGKSLTDLHGPVPGWKSELSYPVEHYFSRLTPKTSMQRSSIFIQITPSPATSLSTSLSPSSTSTAHSLATTLFTPSSKDLFSGTLSNLHPSSILIRRERQTFRFLPHSKVVVFTVKTSLQPLVELDWGERERLLEEVRGWDEDVGRYKGRELWGSTVERFCGG